MQKHLLQQTFFVLFCKLIIVLFLKQENFINLKRKT